MDAHRWTPMRWPCGPLEGFPVLRFHEPGTGGPAPRPFLGVTGLPWPGLKADPAGDAASGPTGPPRIDSNAWFVRLAREVVRPEAIWLTYEPPEDGMVEPQGACVQAIADAAVFGARWIVSLDGLRGGRSRGRAPGGVHERSGRGVPPGLPSAAADRGAGDRPLLAPP